MSPKEKTPGPPPDPLASLEAAAGLALSRGTAPVPPYPAVAREVERALASKQYGTDEVARLVGADAVLAAGVLRIANAALYRRGEPVTALSRAIARVGTRQVFRLLVATGLAEAARAPGPLLALRRTGWIAGLATAHVAEVLAPARGVGEEEAFLGGLLSDFGTLVAAGACEAALRHPPASPMVALPRAAWAAAVERLRAPAGHAAVRTWGLPELFAAVIQGDEASAPALVRLVADARGAARHLATAPHVGPDALSAVGTLSPAERIAASAVLVHLPELVIAFEPPGAEPGPLAPSAVTPEEPPGPWWPLDVKLEVELLLASGGCRCRVLEATGPARTTPAFLALSSPVPLAEEMLLPAAVPGAVPGEAPSDAWVQVVASHPQGAGHRVVVRGVALDDRAWGAWRSRFAGG